MAERCLAGIVVAGLGAARRLPWPDRVALACAAGAFLMTAGSILAYRETYVLDCGTGRLGAFTELLFAALPLAVPLGIGLGSESPSSLSALSRKAAFWAFLTWLVANLFVFGLEVAR